MALTKAQIIELIAEQNGFPKNKSIDIVENLLDIIKRTLESGDDVLVSGFGKFCVKEKGQRRGRNPATGSDLMLSARKVVTFKCSGKLRNSAMGRTEIVRNSASERAGRASPLFSGARKSGILLSALTSDKVSYINFYNYLYY